MECDTKTRQHEAPSAAAATAAATTARFHALSDSAPPRKTLMPPRAPERDQKPVEFDFAAIDAFAVRERRHVASKGAYAPADADAEPRFSLFNTRDEHTAHAASILGLLGAASAASAFSNSGDLTWWLDCRGITSNELSALAQAFGIHPLTAEDILVQEAREKFEVFDRYCFISFHSFDTDASDAIARPKQFYMVAFTRGILTFHNDTVPHPANVRRRVRQLRKYFRVDANWLCYALIDNIIDSFAPFMARIDDEVDEIEDFVFVDTRHNAKLMFLRIADSRHKVMTLAHELSDKALVICGMSRYCQAKAEKHRASQPDAILQADIAMYLDDIQDHIVTMTRNLKSYERILSNSYYNYSAQLQTEKRYNTNRATLLMQLVTVLGTMIFPLQYATGLFAMNIPVPGDGLRGPHRQFFGIIGVSAFLLVVTFTIAKVVIARRSRVTPGENTLRMRKFNPVKQGHQAKSILSYRAHDYISDRV